ncbi:MAG: N-methyl-L-tryptophan oxidase [Gemmataceae bacterium]
MHSVDVIVVGLGGMGSAAAWQLARRGASVLGFEQFRRGHDRGSSHGSTRIIRQAYYEHPAYVPLVRRAYEGWYDLEMARGESLLINSPCLTVGSPRGELVQGVLASADEHGLAVERLTPAEVRRRFPGFHLREDSDQVGVLEHTAGILAVERCVEAMTAEATRLGATLREEEPVQSWVCDGNGVLVRTTRGEYRAGRLVLTSGPWAAPLLSETGHSLRVMRQVALWHSTSRPDLFRRDRFPVYIAETADGYFYGFPMLDPRGVKAARHYGAPEQTHPDEVSREVTAQDAQVVQGFLRDYLPGVDGPCQSGSVCLYTLTPDRHFLIDRLPGATQVVFAAGFSGHGFKFATVVGEILADLALEGKTGWPIELFRRR